MNAATWYLILVVFSNGYSSQSVTEYTSKSACERAARVVAENTNTFFSGANTSCVPDRDIP